TASFWIVRAQGLIYGYFNVFNIARIPESVFPYSLFKIIFTYFLPVIIVANVPAITLARAFQSPWAGLAQLAIGTVFIVSATRAFWRFALRRYSSASS
ncbi:MAG TPA: ABC-2 family transporter protein, partial [Chthoniobacter sp.]|nr:ABC-2 family transporter protein [Chthoniobacter sp.]